MPKKLKKPDTNGRLTHSKDDRAVIILRVPQSLKTLIDKASERETRLRRHNVTMNEWMTRAAIDRIGELYGTSVARELYRNFFNGLVVIETEVLLPEPEPCLQANETNNH